MSDSSFANWLRSLREKQSAPLRIVAAATDLDSTLLSKIELGDRLPTDAQAEALASYYKIHVEEMRRRVVAGRIMQQFGDDPVLYDAISIVREEAGASVGTFPTAKPVNYRAKRRPAR